MVKAAARFIDKATVEAGDVRIKARRFVIATGSSPAVPAIPGLEGVPFFTNETIFDNTRRIDRLIVIGAGSMGLEMAQAYFRLGSHGDGDRSRRRRFTLRIPNWRRSPCAICGRAASTSARVRRVERVEAIQTRTFAPTWTGTGTASSCEGTHLLVATGRRPNISELNLDAANIKSGPKGIVDRPRSQDLEPARLCHRRRRRLARSAHAASYHAGIVIQRALFWIRAKADDTLIPRVTFTDPEIAWVGLSEAEAAASHGRLKVLRFAFDENDRAKAERTTEGHIKVVADKGGRILGAGIVGPQAGELIQLWALAISRGLDLKAMAAWSRPIPTLSDISRQVALGGFAATAGSPQVRWLVSFLSRFG